jgi:hypothetical protein
MSVTKLLSRLVDPSNELATENDSTFGIASDPLTQFACVFSTLIHDVDHAGVPNTQLVKERSVLADRYDGKSVAEQNSIDVAWGLFMKAEYKELRQAICATKSELIRFRQLVVNAVMATDIMDKDLKNIRNMRWTKAFADDGSKALSVTLSDQERMDQVNRKATSVIEHMIQASDVSHTMQHWHIYRKWNELFYLECYSAFVNGRSVVDPTDSWYQGELDFYDYYIIPLAKKMKECGVFGVTGSEYLQYAMNNRSEWYARGKEIVEEMKTRAVQKYLKNELVDI